MLRNSCFFVALVIVTFVSMIESMPQDVDDSVTSILLYLVDVAQNYLPSVCHNCDATQLALVTKSKVLKECLVSTYFINNNGIRSLRDASATFREVVQWSFGNESTQPAHNVKFQTFTVDNKTELDVVGNKTKEYFKLILFAIPYMKNLSECPVNITGNRSLRQHGCIFKVEPGTRPSFRRRYDKIFTGCYYVVMKNNRDEKWLVGPDFYDTSYHYLDSKLEVDENRTQPESLEKTKELITVIKVPECTGVNAKVYEFPGEVNATFDEVIRKDMLNETLRATQDCEIYISVEGQTECSVSNLTTRLGAEVSTKRINGTSWSATIRWTNLLRGGNTYYLRFKPIMAETECFIGSNSPSYDYTRWYLVDEEIFLPLGYQEATNLVTNVKSSDLTFVAFALLGLIVIAIVAYGLFKFLPLINVCREMNEFQEPRETNELPEKESEHILLIYVKGCPLFMKMIDSFRNQLKQDCHSHVHDLYATDEWEMVVGLGAIGWVEKLMRNGSKVVWVDTPQFRSRINKNQNQQIEGDFRDAAVPYAVAVATTLFVNATTQYRRHFVVRVKGFAVDDDSDDPLLVVSPHARYYIPEQIPLLCEHLNGPSKLLNSTTVEL